MSGTRDEQRVTPLELFFDLVFVFALTQVTGYLGAGESWGNVLQGIGILLALWWAWVAYAWVANAAGSEDGPARVALLAAVAAMLVVSLAVPDAFGASAVWFAGGLLVVRLLHLSLYWILGRHDAGLRAVLRRLAVPLSVGPALLVAGALLDGPLRATAWVAALAVDYTGPVRSAGEGSRVAPGHFAERFGLIVIVALGESIVSIGVGADGATLDLGLVTAAVVAAVAAAALWWAYFDVTALAVERRFASASPSEQVRVARDCYMYLHTLTVLGIILFALGVKKTLAHVDEPLSVVAAAALCGGVALYLVSLAAFRRRGTGTLPAARVGAAAVLVLAAPLATRVDATAALAVVASVLVALVAHETVRERELRHDLRART